MRSPLIAEWDYGRYEGLTTAQTRELQPDCLVWTHGCPGDESVARSPIVLTEPSPSHCGRCVRTCYAEMTVPQVELRSGRAPIMLGAFTFRRGWPCRVDGAAHRTAHRCAA
jgi:hypothetical protein